MARQVTVQITGDSKGFSKATEEAQSAAGRFGGIMTGIAQGIGQGIFGLATSAVSQLSSAIKQSDQLFREDQSSIALLGQTLQDNIAGWDGNNLSLEKYVTLQGKLGFSAIQTRDALGQLVGVTHDVRLATEDLSIAEDFSRAHHLDLAEGVDIVSKATAGNVKALKVYGIEIIAAKDHLDAYLASTKKHVPAAEEAAKALDRQETAANALKAMLDQTKGSAEAYANTSQGRLEAAQAINQASWVKIGAIVNQVSSVVLPLVAQAFSALADWVTAHGVPIFNQIRAVVEQIAKAFMGLLAPALTYIRDHFDQLKPVLVVIGAVAVIALGLIVGAILVVIATVVLLVAGIAFFVQKWEEHWAKAQSDWTNFENTVIGGVRRVIGVLNEIPGVHINLPQLQGLGGTAQLGTHSGGLQSFASGGVVQGSGAQLVIAHGGETISPAGRGGGDLHIHIDQGAYIDGPSVDRLANLILQRARYAPGV